MNLDAMRAAGCALTMAPATATAMFNVNFNAVMALVEAIKRGMLLSI